MQYSIICFIRFYQEFFIIDIENGLAFFIMVFIAENTALIKGGEGFLLLNLRLIKYSDRICKVGGVNNEYYGS